jgi:hypothetical protein
MKRLLKLTLALGLVVALLVPAGMALAADSETFDFPSGDSTVIGSYPFTGDEVGSFWSVSRGDSVRETFSTSMAAIDGAVLDVEVGYNNLAPGAYVDWDVEINGVVVDSFTVNDGFTGTIHREMSFAPITGPDYDVALIVTNEVPGGLGSHRFYYMGAHAHSIELISSEIGEIPVDVDIKPASCPNPLNVGSKGVLPVAILGREDFDITQVDPVTVSLEGVAPLRWALEDVAGPECSGPDGYLDLTLKFNMQEIVAALGAVDDGEVLTLMLTGNLKADFDSIPIVGDDEVVILKKK